MSSLYERAGEVFLAALSLPVEERDGFLVEACKDDEELLKEVASLLFFIQLRRWTLPRARCSQAATG